MKLFNYCKSVNLYNIKVISNYDAMMELPYLNALGVFIYDTKGRNYSFEYHSC